VVGLLEQAYDAFHDVGIHPSGVNTSVTYEYAREEALDEQTAIAYATRFYLVSIYGTSVGIKRAYFYNWPGTRLPIPAPILE
jgi:hypothetical protein